MGFTPFTDDVKDDMERDEGKPQDFRECITVLKKLKTYQICESI